MIKSLKNLIWSFRKLIPNNSRVFTDKLDEDGTIIEFNDSDAGIAFESLKNHEKYLEKSSAELIKDINANNNDLIQKQNNKDKYEKMKFKFNEEINVIGEYEKMVSSETNSLNSFINRNELKQLEISNNPTKKFFHNINQQITKFIHEINQYPKEYEKYKQDSHSRYSKIVEDISIIQREINILKNEKESNEEKNRIIKTKLTAIKDFEKNILNPTKLRLSQLETGQSIGYTKLANKTHAFMTKLTNKDEGFLVPHKNCHGEGCLGCDNTGYEDN